MALEPWGLGLAREILRSTVTVLVAAWGADTEGLLLLIRSTATVVFTNLIGRESRQIAQCHRGVALDEVGLSVQKFDDWQEAMQRNERSFAVHVCRQVTDRHS